MDSKPAAAMVKESLSQPPLTTVKQSITAAETQRKGNSKVPEKQPMNINNYHHQYHHQAQPIYVKKEDRTVASLMGDNGDDDDEIGLDELDDEYLNADSPSPPPVEFQRHNSMTRKQATSLAMQRAMQIQQKSPVVSMSLSQLPPLENCIVESDLEVLANASPGVKQAVQAHYQVHSHIAHSQSVHGHGHGHYTNRQHNNPIQVQFHATGMGGMIGGAVRGVPATSPSTENLVLAPPPQFSDDSGQGQGQQHQMGYHHVGHYHGGGGGGNGQQNVRIVGAVPKSTNRF